MRKLNTILSVLLLFICLLHGLMGSFMLLGISSGAGKFLAWIGVGILAAHTVLGLLLTAQTFRASRSGGKLYGKQNGSVLGKAHQWACYFAHALFPYWRVRQSAGRRIHSVSVHNGPAADAAFTGCFGICASSAQSPTPSGIAGHRPG